jgi:hypothetical protein
MGKHINRADSVTICRLYKKHKGKMDKLMQDPEIKAMGYERHKIDHHLSYKKRVIPHVRRPLKAEVEEEDVRGGDSSDSFETSQSEEGEVQTLLGRKMGQGGTPTRWLARFSNGEERWERESFFVRFDGSADPIFEAFEASHAFNNDIVPRTLRKREAPPPREDEKERVTKKPTLKRQLSEASLYLLDLQMEKVAPQKEDVENAPLALPPTPVPEAQTTIQMMSMHILERLMRDTDILEDIKKLDSDLLEVRDSLSAIRDSQVKLVVLLDDLSKKVL